MTFQSKAVLRALKKLTNNTSCEICYLGDSPCFCLDNEHRFYDYSKYEKELASIMDSLIEEGYIKYTYNEFHFQLTQKAIHRHQYLGETFFKTLFSAVILPIIVSVITTLITLWIHTL